MNLAVVAYPRLDEADRQRIEAFRSKHDPQAARLGVHFTLVFPFDGSPAGIGPEVVRVAGSTPPIPFAIDRVEVVPDALEDRNLVLLVPADGREPIVGLHDRLYSGTLERHLRLDIPFVPHMTVGAAPNSQSARVVAEELEAGFRRPMRGVLDRLDVVDVSKPRVCSIARFALGVRYREASASDVADMARSRAADPAAGPADPRMAAYLEGRHHPRHALLPRVAFVALQEDGVVGYIAGHLTRRYDCDGEVQYLFVTPSHRRMGVGTELLRRLAGWFAGQRAFRICVDVNVDSPAADPFYTWRGARPLNRYWRVWDDIRKGAIEDGDSCSPPRHAEDAG